MFNEMITHRCLFFLQKPTVQAFILPKWWLKLDLGKIDACTVGFCKNPIYLVSMNYEPGPIIIMINMMLLTLSIVVKRSKTSIPWL